MVSIVWDKAFEETRRLKSLTMLHDHAVTEYANMIMPMSVLQWGECRITVRNLQLHANVRTKTGDANPSKFFSLQTRNAMEHDECTVHRWDTFLRARGGKHRITFTTDWQKKQ